AGQGEYYERRIDNIRYCFHGFISFQLRKRPAPSWPGKPREASMSFRLFCLFFVLSQRYCPKFDRRLRGKPGGDTICQKDYWLFWRGRENRDFARQQFGSSVGCVNEPFAHG